MSCGRVENYRPVSDPPPSASNQSVSVFAIRLSRSSSRCLTTPSTIRLAVAFETRFSMIANRSKIALVYALLIASNLSATDLSAYESSTARCSANIRKFVEAIDLLLTERPRSIEAYYDPIRTYLVGTRGCNVDEVISISKNSKFFSELGEQYTTYVIVFQSKSVVVSFGLKKDTGNIETPAAYVRFPAR